MVHFFGPASHLIGLMPKLERMLFISAVSRSPKIKRKVIPATTTHTSAGIKSDERKKSFAIIFFEFSITARINGIGIRIAQVQIV